MELQIIEQNGMRVLTTSQLADSFGVDPKVINKNFRRNLNRYEQGKHYFALTGDDLKSFKADRHNDAKIKFAPVIHLWTEQGAFLHAKSLSNEKAWEVYTSLTESYFNLTEKLKSPEELIAIQDKKILEMAEKINKMEKGMMTIQTQMQEQITLNSGEQKRLQKAVGERAFALEKDSAARGPVFRGIYSAIKKQFAVKSYRDVKQYQLQKAIQFVEKWNG